MIFPKKKNNNTVDKDNQHVLIRRKSQGSSPSAKFQNKIQKVFLLRRLPLSRFLAKTLESEFKIDMKNFFKKNCL